MSKTIAIVGAGITGLSLAFYLEQLGLNTIVIEKEKHVGGAINSKKINDYLLENGPNTVLLTPGVLSLIKDLGLLKEIIIPELSSKKKYLVFKKNNKLTLQQVPKNLLQLFGSKLLSLKAKLSILFEPLRKQITEEDLSVASFVERKFCKEISEKFFSAYLSGIWAADLSKLSARSALSDLWYLNKKYSSILLGLIVKSFKKNKSKKIDFFSFKNGLSTLTNGLVNKLKNSKIYLGTTVEKIDFATEEIIKLSLKSQNGEENSEIIVEADLVVFTTAVDTTKNILQNNFFNLLIPNIYYAPLGIIHFSVAKDSIKTNFDGFGFLLPQTEDTALLGGIFTSSVFANRAPQNQHLISCFCGGALREQYADPGKISTKEKIIAELKEILEIKEDPQEIASVFYPSAIPNYQVGHYQIQESLNNFHQSQNKIRICANWEGGISLASRLETTKIFATEILRIWAYK